MRALEKFHPGVLFVYFLAVLSVTMFVRHPMITAASLLGGLLLQRSLDGRKRFWKDMGFYIPLLALITVTNPLFSHNGVTQLFFLNGNAVTLEAVACGVHMGMMIVAVLLWCAAMNRLFTGDKVMYLLGRIAPGLSLVFSMVLRFVPQFRKKRKEIMTVQKAMGLYTSKSYTDRLLSSVRVYSALIGWALEHSMEVGVSMKAKGYGQGRRTNFHLFRRQKRDSGFLAITLVLTCVTLTGVLTGKTHYDFYPAMDRVENGCLWAVAAFAVLAVMPFILAEEEKCRWNYYLRKT